MTARTDSYIGSQTVLSAILLALIGVAAAGLFVTPTLMRKDFSLLTAEEAEKTENLASDLEEQLSSRRSTLEEQLGRIDAKSLRLMAAKHYKHERDARRSYDKRFALTAREKAQLDMRMLASDSTKSLHDAIRAVARQASPKGAKIDVNESAAGIALDIDFDMSSVTSGEHGTRTKHHTKESLRKEVVSLISKVTNDIFQFCRDLDLESIHVGCRHHVRTTNEYGRARDENIVLYKIRIERSRIPKLTSNPFLDVYSTTSYFEVDSDKFDDIEIVTTRT